MAIDWLDPFAPADNGPLYKVEFIGVNGQLLDGRFYEKTQMVDYCDRLRKHRCAIIVGMFERKPFETEWRIWEGD